MLLTRQQLAARLFAAAPRDGRAGMEHLRIDPPVEGVSTVWATNGHTLVRCKALTPPDEEFPAMLGIPASAASPTETILLPAHTARLVEAALRKLRASSRGLPILRYALLKRDGDVLYLAVTDLENPQVWQVRVPDAIFPNVEDVLPGGRLGGGMNPEAVPVGLSGHYLGLVSKYRDQFDTRNSLVKVTLRADKAALFEWTDSDTSHEVLCLVMPMHLPEPPVVTPVEDEPEDAGEPDPTAEDMEGLEGEPAECQPEQPGEVPNEADNPVYAGGGDVECSTAVD